MDKVSTVTSCVRRWSPGFCVICALIVLLTASAVRPARGLTIAGRYNRPDQRQQQVQSEEVVDEAEVDLESADTLRIRLVRSLGLTRMPDLSQGPIPKEMMDEAYETYRRKLRQTERRHQEIMAEEESYEDGDHEEDSFTVNYNSQGIQPPANMGLPDWTALSSGNGSASAWFYYKVDLSNDSASPDDVDVVQAYLQTLGGQTVWWWSSSVDHDRVGRGQWEPMSHVIDEDDEDDVDRKWDASEALRTWVVQNPNTLNRGVVLVSRRDSWPTATSANDNRLRLEVLLKRGSAGRRSKRSTPHDLLKEPAWTGKTDCRKGTRHNYCCRKSLTVTAEQLGLGDIIIEPKKFNFYHCRGKCPHKYNPASTHAILQSLIYRTYKKGGKVCCAPSKLGDLEVVHLDEAGKKPVHSQWKNAVVLECACS